MKKILVITHDTSLSGAPKSLVLFLEELKNFGYEVSTLVLIAGGGLEQRFIEVSTYYYRLYDKSKKINYPFLKRVKNKVKPVVFESEYDVCIQDIVKVKYDFIYANTIVSIPMATLLNSKIGTKLIVHIHELATVIDEFLPDFANYDLQIQHYIVPSYLNKKCLETDFNISSDKISVIREASELKEMKLNNDSDTRKEKKKNEIRVLMCGGSYWRKGDDLFVLIAKKVLSKNSDYHFYWVGSSSKERARVNQSDIKKLGIEKNIHFINETNEPEFWFQSSDIFLLPSREDPFPLAAIEAGMAGLPILCFQNATGICEVVSEDFTVPYLALDLIVDKILLYSSDSIFFNEEGQRNKSFFSTCTGRLIGKQILNLLENS